MATCIRQRLLWPVHQLQLQPAWLTVQFTSVPDCARTSKNDPPPSTGLYAFICCAYVLCVAEDPVVGVLQVKAERPCCQFKSHVAAMCTCRYLYCRHRATSSNICVNCAGSIVTYAAAVCVVYDAAKHSQAFFRGHDDDLCCLALAPDKRTAASGQLGKDPVVLVSMLQRADEQQ